MATFKYIVTAELDDDQYWDCDFDKPDNLTAYTIVLSRDCPTCQCSEPTYDSVGAVWLKSLSPSDPHLRETVRDMLPAGTRWRDVTFNL